MESENLVCEGIVDVGPIVIAHFENPAQEEALEFLESVLNRDTKAVIPTTSFVGAYHVMTSYIGIDPLSTSKSLSGTLELQTPAFYENIRKEDVLEGLNTASSYKIESWDAVMLNLAERLGTRTLFSIDEKLSEKAEQHRVVNPIPGEKIEEYHSFLEENT